MSVVIQPYSFRGRIVALQSRTDIPEEHILISSQASMDLRRITQNCAEVIFPVTTTTLYIYRRTVVKTFEHIPCNFVFPEFVMSENDPFQAPISHFSAIRAGSTFGSIWQAPFRQSPIVITGPERLSGY